MESRFSPLAAAVTLAADAIAAELVPALRARGIPALLIKGPSLVGWLYREDEGRTYTDVDILVPPHAEADAEDVLRSLGFEAVPPKAGSEHGIHARPWARPEGGASVDLHRQLPGVRASPADAWSILYEGRSQQTINRLEVDILGEPARALLIALHMAHHQAEEPHFGYFHKPVVDLRVALDRLPESVWPDAAELATRLHCRERLSHGLHADPRGAELARRLGLPSGDWVTVGARSATAAAFERLSATHGFGARLRLVLRFIVPPPHTLRFQSRLARRGPLGLAAAYVLRPFVLVVSGVPGLLEWRRLRRR